MPQEAKRSAAQSQGACACGAVRLEIDVPPLLPRVEIDADAERRAVESLAAHKAYLADLPWHPSPDEFVPGLLSQQGEAAGVERAVVFAAQRLRGK